MPMPGASTKFSRSTYGRCSYFRFVIIVGGNRGPRIVGWCRLADNGGRLTMPAKKILMLTGEFTEEYEIFVFQQAMEAVGHTVHVICPDKKAGEIIKTSLHDFEGHQTYTEKPGHD